MKHGIRLKIVQVLILVSGLGGAGILGAAGSCAGAEAKSQEAKHSVATTNPLKSRPLKDLPPEKIRSIVMNWPEQKKISAWNALNAEQQRTAHDIVHGETSPLRNFPPGLVPLVVSYMDIEAETYAIEKDKMVRAIGEFRPDLRAKAATFPKPLSGLIAVQADWGNLIYLFITTHIGDGYCLLMLEGEKLQCTGANDHKPTNIPECKELYNVPFKGLDFRGDRLRPKEATYVPWDTGESLDCRIADYDEKEQGGTCVEWNVYNREEAERICALYGACRYVIDLPLP